MMWGFLVVFLLLVVALFTIRQSRIQTKKRKGRERVKGTLSESYSSISPTMKSHDAFSPMRSFALNDVDIQDVTDIPNVADDAYSRTTKNSMDCTSDDSSSSFSSSSRYSSGEDFSSSSYDSGGSSDSGSSFD